MNEMANYEQMLKQSLSKYKQPEIAKRDVLCVFTTFVDLRPIMEEFVYNDGSKKMLLNLYGTIPVTFKGVMYNIPICIWINDTHPYNPPMVYVRPTASMQIKHGRNVDMNGKIDLPYLREWKYPNSDLLGMIQILTIVFGEEPPVYSKSQPPPPRYQPSLQAPYPAQNASPFPMPLSAGGSPYCATQSYPTPVTYPQATYPQARTNLEQFSGPPGQTGGYQGYLPSYPASTTGTSSYPSNTSYPPAYSQAITDMYPPTAAVSSSKYVGNDASTVTEEHLMASLLSAVEDKIKWRLKETFGQAQAEMDVLYRTYEDLSKGKTKLEQIIQGLEHKKIQMEKNVELLKQKDGEVQETITRLEKAGQLSIDDAVVTTAPLYRQLLKCFAEEQAIEDAIYYLGEALRKNVIDLEVFLKQVRELSRKQFMLRALIHKCRERAGLPPIS